MIINNFKMNPPGAINIGYMLCLSLCFLLISCQEIVEITIEEESEGVPRIVLEEDSDLIVEELSIAKFGSNGWDFSNPEWRIIIMDDTQNTNMDVIVYGILPDNYRTLTPPKILEYDAQYEVFIKGKAGLSAGVRFYLDSEGHPEIIE